MRGPLTLEQADEIGLPRPELRRRSWRRIGPRTYARRSVAESTLTRLEGARCRIPAVGVFSGLTAAWLHGLEVDACNPIEVTIPKGAGISGRAGMRVGRACLSEAEIDEIRGFRATSVLRNIQDLSRRLPLTEATVIADMALHLGLTDLAQLRTWARSRRGGRGVVTLRRVADCAEPLSESPMETRLRMLLVLAGLPRPLAQVPIHDASGRFAGRPDLYYADRRLGLEYDGGTHRETLAGDNRRQSRLLQAGIHLLRFTAADVLSRPAAVVAQVRALLAPQAWPTNVKVSDVAVDVTTAHPAKLSPAPIVTTPSKSPSLRTSSSSDPGPLEEIVFRLP